MQLFPAATETMVEEDMVSELPDRDTTLREEVRDFILGRAMEYPEGFPYAKELARRVNDELKTRDEWLAVDRTVRGNLRSRITMNELAAVEALSRCYATNTREDTIEAILDAAWGMGDE